MRRAFPLIGIPVLALALASCTATTPDPVSTTDDDGAATASQEPETTEPDPDGSAAPVADPTCESILSEDYIASLTALGWTYTQEDFRVGDTVVEGGIECMWGDYSVASDHVQVYGWAPIDDSAASQAQQDLLAQGWQRADKDGHVYITTASDVVMDPDEDGYGTTYEFGDGWVTIADTRQGLLLISQP